MKIIFMFGLCLALGFLVAKVRRQEKIIKIYEQQIQLHKWGELIEAHQFYIDNDKRNLAYTIKIKDSISTAYYVKDITWRYGQIELIKDSIQNQK